VSTARRLALKARAGRLLLVVLVASALAGVIWYRRLAPDDGAQAPAGGPNDDRAAEMVSRDFRHVETRMDRTIWILEAAQAEVANDYGKLTSVKVTWYGDSATPVVITSRSGEVDFRKRKAILVGAVRVERADGAVLTTESLLWDEASKHLRATEPVLIATPAFTFEGRRMDADLDAERFLLHGGVQGDVQVGRAAPAAGTRRS
jgi:LPS export ABC transporter protein LptC